MAIYKTKAAKKQDKIIIAATVGFVTIVLPVLCGFAFAVSSFIASTH